MAKKAGKTGAVGYGDSGSAVAGITQWALDYTVDMLETTDFAASGVATYIPGVSRWSGTFSGYKDGAPLGLGTANTVSIYLVESTATGEQFRGLAYISGIHPTVNFDGIAGYAYDFQGTGALTVAST